MAAILSRMRSPVPLARTGECEQHVEGQTRPCRLVVLNDWVTETKATPAARAVLGVDRGAHGRDIFL